MTSFRGLYITVVAALAAIALAACDSWVYEDQGDCDPHYKVRFVYDHNLKYADAFSAEVGEVTLYVIDPETGAILREIHDDSPAVSEPGYLMDLPDLAPGRYELLAWCGEGHRSHFTVNETQGDLREHLRCRLTARESLGDAAHVRDQLGHLYHGKTEPQVFPDTEGEHVFTVKLMKNTNDLHVVLQHLNGEPVNPDDFVFNITDRNGHLDWNNDLLDDERLTYHPWWTASVSAGVELPDGTITPSEPTKAQTQSAAALADLRTSRLMDGSDARVTISRADNGETVASIPLTQYCTMVKGQHRHLSDQEYLDRQDDYSMVFFLDEQDRWMDAYIYVQSWKVVIQHTDL